MALSGMSVCSRSLALVGDADIVLAVQPPDLPVVEAMKQGAILISFVYAHKEPQLTQTVARSKDHLLCHGAGPADYSGTGHGCAVESGGAGRLLLGAAGSDQHCTYVADDDHCSRIDPSAARTGHGPGCCGLQALATARRLGAMTEGYDVRPETKEQAESLGAKFVDTGVDARGAGGYARELTQEEKDKIASVVTRHIQSADMIITTAAIPGRPSPKLISKAQVEGMKAGSVIVDLAAEGGGNCEYTQPGETVQVGQVTIAGPLNVPSMLGEHASELYAKNQFNLIELFLKDKAIALDWNDEVIAKTALTHAGEIRNEAARKAVENA